MVYPLDNVTDAVKNIIHTNDLHVTFHDPLNTRSEIYPVKAIRDAVTLNNS